MELHTPSALTGTSPFLYTMHLLPRNTLFWKCMHVTQHRHATTSTSSIFHSVLREFILFWSTRLNLLIKWMVWFSSYGFVSTFETMLYLFTYFIYVLCKMYGYVVLVMKCTNWSSWGSIFWRPAVFCLGDFRLESVYCIDVGPGLSRLLISFFP